jgi:DNA repair protein RadA/Sms
MPKAHSKFVCQQCGYESAKWLGRCPDCSAWNSLVETPDVAPARAEGRGAAHGGFARALPLPEVPATAGRRQLTGSPELDRVLGGGLVAGSLVLIGGEPGIGKSTLALQVAGDVALRGPESSVLYVSAEESAQQVKLRAERLGIQTERLLLLPETDLHGVTDAVEQLRPALVVVDSIQTVALPEIASAPGSISQVRECTMHLMRLAKQRQVSILLIGHVTEEGTVAGPRALEHIVDAVLYLEGERFHTYRLLRGVKNRFGATNEVGVYEMRGEGLVDVVGGGGEHGGHAPAAGGGAGARLHHQLWHAALHHLRGGSEPGADAAGRALQACGAGAGQSGRLPERSRRLHAQRAGGGSGRGGGGGLQLSRAAHPA